MADKKISQLPAATTPLAGTEVLPIVQGGVTDKVSVANLTAGRAISAAEVTLSTGNLVIGTSGKGIDFSATPDATATSELLADYEEGTWVPSLSRGAGFSYAAGANDSGYYTKVGRVVYCVFNFDGTFSGGSGLYSVTGLPYTSAAYSGYNTYTGIMANSSTGSGSPGVILLMGGSTSSATLFGSPTSGQVFTCSFFYHV